MTLKELWRDRRGASAVEFGLTGPAFFVLLTAVLQAGLLLWTQLGLQHGVEMAARCASVNASVCSSASTIQAYAVRQSYGAVTAADAFTIASASCGKQVSASYPFQPLAGYFGAITLTAQSCFAN